MSPATMKVLAIVLFVVCAILLFVAWERYETNRGNVEAVNRMMDGSPLQRMTGQGELKPAMPASTKYSLLTAVVCGGGGIALLVIASSRGKGGNPMRAPYP